MPAPETGAGARALRWGEKQVNFGLLPYGLEKGEGVCFLCFSSTGLQIKSTERLGENFIVVRLVQGGGSGLEVLCSLDFKISCR